MTVDPLRHLEVFGPEEFGNRKVAVIGAGATGSAVVVQLAKLGVANLHVYDFDTVEAHNLANQVYGVADVGKPKVEALAEYVKKYADLDIHAHNEEVTGQNKDLGKCIFLLTDTMASRKQIFEKAIRYNPSVEIMIETRMDVDTMMVYSINPLSPSDIKEWESTLYGDENTARSACGSSVTVGATAQVLAGIAVWQFIKWASKKERSVSGETILGLRPFNLLTREFGI